MLEALDTISWVDMPQPPWNLPGAIPQAIRTLAAPLNEDHSQDAYNALLSAIGNNHGGTYYPVVLEILPFLAEILDQGSLLARLRTLDILIDLLAAFDPEIGYENISYQNNTVRPLASLLMINVLQIWTTRRHRFLSASDTKEQELAHTLDETITALQ